MTTCHHVWVSWHLVSDADLGLLAYQVCTGCAEVCGHIEARAPEHVVAE